MVEELNNSILAKIGSAIAWIFGPLGWTKAGEGWKMAVAAVTGLIAKENVVATFGMLFGFAEVAEDGAEIWGNLAQVMTPIAAYGFLVFNLLVCTLLRSNGRYQERDEQHKMVLVCNRISVRSCLCSFTLYLSDRYTDHYWNFRYWHSGCFHTGCMLYLSVIQTIQREQYIKSKCKSLIKTGTFTACIQQGAGCYCISPEQQEVSFGGRTKGRSSKGVLSHMSGRKCRKPW